MRGNKVTINMRKKAKRRGIVDSGFRPNTVPSVAHVPTSGVLRNPFYNPFAERVAAFFKYLAGRGGSR